MTETPLSQEALALIAITEFRARRDWVAQQLAHRRIDAATASARLRPWLAICALCGADLPELACPSTQVWPQTGPETPDHWRAHDIDPQGHWRTELARARNAALASHDPSGAPQRTVQARNLCRLADALGLPPFNPSAPAQEQAA
jgi:hypothetical protein